MTKVSLEPLRPIQILTESHRLTKTTQINSELQKASKDASKRIPAPSGSTSASAYDGDGDSDGDASKMTSISRP